MSCHEIVQSVAAITTGTAAKTIQTLTAAANHGIKIKRVEVGFDGTSTTSPQVLVELIKSTVSGGSGSSAANPVEANPDEGGTVQSTGVSGYTSEPTHTSPAVIFNTYVHPQGKYIWIPPSDAFARVAPGTSLSVRVTVGTAVNYAGTISADE